MKRVLASVKLTDINVNVENVHRTKADGILIQVKEKDEADRLSSHLQSAIGEKAKINRGERLDRQGYKHASTIRWGISGPCVDFS